jgi:hypothetical protein
MKNRKMEMSTLSAWSTFAIAVLTFALVLVAAVNFNKFVHNVKLMADSVRQQAESIDLQRKDFILTHKPIVFIKSAFAPKIPEEKNDPFKHAFVLTNTGKLPAREVRITVVINQVVGTNIAIDNTQNIPVLENASIYPSSDLAFWITKAINLGGLPSKAEAIFTITYKGEGIEQVMRENMKFIFSKDTTYTWVYVGPNVDIFRAER